MVGIGHHSGVWLAVAARAGLQITRKPVNFVLVEKKRYYSTN